MTLLETRALRRDYERGATVFPAVADASLTMAAGDFVSIFGRSGSGKTTFLGMIAGLICPTSGSVSVNGRDLTGLDDGAASDWRNRCLGYVPQGASLLGHLSVLDNVRLPHFLSKRAGDGLDRARTLLHAVELGSLGDALPRVLSGGEMRRVAIARALMNDPPLIVADEPTSDLDIETTETVVALFKQVNRTGTAVLTVTHDPAFTTVGGRIFEMSDGILRPKIGSAAEVSPADR